MVTSRRSRKERRQHPRSVVGIPVEMVRRNLPEQDPNRVMGLHVTDLSRGGARAVSHRPLPRAEPVTMFFPPLGSARGEDTVGQIVRCDACGTCWEVGIAFETPSADDTRIPAS